MGAGYHGGFGNTKNNPNKNIQSLHADRQGKHILGNKNYIPGKSIFIGTLIDALDLINKYSGKGISIGVDKEKVDFGKIIGYFVDKKTGEKYPTTMGIIHSSKDGKHIVPARPKDYKGD